MHGHCSLKYMFTFLHSLYDISDSERVSLVSLVNTGLLFCGCHIFTLYVSFTVIRDFAVEMALLNVCYCVDTVGLQQKTEVLHCNAASSSN